MTYRARREARAIRLREWAEKREERAAADLAKAREMGEVIPFGQPILAGHHSEGRDRRYRERIAGTYDRAFESAAKAKSMASRASNIEDQLDVAIYDDDPDAVERLEERITRLEAEREDMKKANAAYRREHRAELAGMSPYERSRAVPFPGYALSNLGGRITTARHRLDGIREARRRAAAAEEAGGVAITPLPAFPGYISVTFAEKPDRSILDALKAAGFTWWKGSWTGKADALPDLPALRPGGF